MVFLYSKALIYSSEWGLNLSSAGKAVNLTLSAVTLVFENFYTF